MKKTLAVFGLLLVSLTAVFAGGSGEKATGAPQTVTMIFDAVQQNHDALYQEYAQKYMTAHPGV